jgi:hypothetical protein
MNFEIMNLPKAFRVCPLCKKLDTLEMKRLPDKKVYLGCNSCNASWLSINENGMRLAIGDPEYIGTRTFEGWAELTGYPLNREAIFWDSKSKSESKPAYPQVLWLLPLCLGFLGGIIAAVIIGMKYPTGKWIWPFLFGLFMSVGAFIVFTGACVP